MTGQYHRRNISGRKSNAIVHDFCNCWQVKRARILIHEQSKIKREWKWKEGESRSVVSDSLRPHGLQSPWNSPGQNTGRGSLSLLQGIFPTQRLNPGLPHCRQILYQLSHKGSPRILEWVAYPFSSGSSWIRNRTRVSCIASGFFTNWTMMETVKAYFWTQYFIPLKFYLLLCQWRIVLTI